MKRLYLKLYLALIGVLVVTGIVFAVVGHLAPLRHSGAGRLPQIAARALWRSLPPPDHADFERVLEQRARELEVDLAVYHEAHGRLADAALEPLPTVESLREGWTRGPGGAFYVLPIEGPYWLAARDRTAHRPRVAHGLFMMAAFAGILALACYPVARAMTRRLETLEEGVEQWGTGKLSRRVPVEGRDEIAALAASFNRAAERIEGLVAAQRGVLANASHELRSPLARLRVALELVLDELDPDARRRLLEEANRDIDVLNGLVEEVLEAARSEARLEHGLERSTVDLAALVREEAARFDASVVSPDAMPVIGDGRLLRRLVRNLLDNAARYAPAAPIDVELSKTSAVVELAVRDRGPGVAEADRERIFLPFYRPAGHREGVHGGVGLGLSLVKQVAEAHHGSVEYAPRPGGGACFVVRLPAA
ncbi:MAG TPA: HAMP domain-containing sensor histidine kinase [Polyangiaceae bacterium]|nr:HAMP domain-containing sensor histidine kinase [Polyangiaceae bacterium]